MAEVQEEKIFEIFLENVDSVIHQLNSEYFRSQEGSSDKFWQRIQVASKIISSSITKLSVLYSKSPYPTETDCRVILNQAEQGLLSTISSFYSLRKSDGLLLRSILKRNLIFLCESIKEFVIAMQKLSKNQITQNEFRTATGIVWSRCDKFQRLPKNNKEAVVEKLQNEIGMLEDASGELDCAQDNESAEEFFSDVEDSPEQESWCESERPIVQTFQKILRLTCSIVQNSASAVEKNEDVTIDMDTIYENCKKFSPVIDEIVNSLYPPLNKAEAAKNSELLKRELKNILKELPHYNFINEDDAEWINLYEKEVNEHLNELVRLLGKEE